MGLFRDKKDIKTIMDLEDTITYLRKLLQAKETTMSQLEITADLRLKEIARLKNELDKYKPSLKSKVVLKSDKIVSKIGDTALEVNSEGIQVRKRRIRKVAKKEN